MDLLLVRYKCTSIPRTRTTLIKIKAILRQINFLENLSKDLDLLAWDWWNSLGEALAQKLDTTGFFKYTFYDGTSMLE